MTANKEPNIDMFGRIIGLEKTVFSTNLPGIEPDPIEVAGFDFSTEDVMLIIRMLFAQWRERNPDEPIPMYMLMLNWKNMRGDKTPKVNGSILTRFMSKQQLEELLTPKSPDSSNESTTNDQ